MKRNIFIIALVWFGQISFAVAQNHAVDSLEHLLQNEKEDTARILLLDQLSMNYEDSKPDTALLLAEQELILAGKIKFEKGEITGLSRLGSVFTFTGNDGEGLKLLLKALKKAEKTNEGRLMTQILSSIGAVYSNQGDVRKSLEYDFRARNMGLLMNDKDRIASSSLDIGDGYEKLNQLDSAIYFTKRGYEMEIKKSSSEGIGTALNNMGNIYSKMLKPDTAMSYYRMSIPYSLNANLYDNLSETTLGMAKLFKQKNEDDSCLQYAKFSYAIAKKGGFIVEGLNASEFLADYYKHHHVVDSAYTYLSAVISAKDSMFSQEKIRSIQNLSFDETIRQQEIAAQKKQTEENHVRNLQLLAIGVFIPIFFIGVLLLSRTKVRPRVVEFLGILSLLLFFEFITDLIYPYVGRLTNDNPIWEMLFLVSLAALLEPLNFKLEHWVKGHLVRRPAHAPIPVMVAGISNDPESVQEL
jgi:tetratricopeptide (TPR) repeat protein